MLEFTRLLPDQHNVNSVVNANSQDEAEGEDIEQIQIDAQQFHRSDHSADGKR